MHLSLNLSVVAVLVASNAVIAADIGPTLLFKEVKSSLSPEDKRDIYRQLGLATTRDGKHFVLKTLTDCGAFDPEVLIEDLNGDGTPEISVAYGNTCTSSAGGSSLSLFIKDKSGKYRLKETLHNPSN